MTETITMPSAMTETEPIISEVNEIDEDDFKYIPTE